MALRAAWSLRPRWAFSGDGTLLRELEYPCHRELTPVCSRISIRGGPMKIPGFRHLVFALAITAAVALSACARGSAGVSGQPSLGETAPPASSQAQSSSSESDTASPTPGVSMEPDTASPTPEVSMEPDTASPT